MWLGWPQPPRRSPGIGDTEVLAATALMATAAWIAFAWFRPNADARLPIVLFTVQILALGAAVAALEMRPRQLWRHRIAHAVTDRRALILERGLLGTRAESFGPHLIAHIWQRPRLDGLCDVVLRRAPGLRGDENPIGFFGDGPGAARALDALRRSAGTAPPPMPRNPPCRASSVPDRRPWPDTP